MSTKHRDQWELCECCGTEHVSAQAWHWINKAEVVNGQTILVDTNEQPPRDDVWCHQCESEVRTVTVDHAAEGFQLADTAASDVFYSSLDKLRAGCGLWPNHEEEGADSEGEG